MKKRNIGICIITTTLLMGGPAKATELILAKDHTNVVNQAAEIAAYKSNRPPVNKRLFKSKAVEAEIIRVKKLLTNQKLAWMFENCFPNTLETTVHYRTTDGKPDTFVYTGDIHAMWLRDSGAQVWPYIQLANKDPELKKMLEGVIRRQFKCINIDPYANAFNDGAVGGDWMSDLTDMKPELHERKWEIDSLCYPLRLAYQYWKETGDASIFDNEWIQAIANILTTFKEQQRKEGVGPYKFQRKTERALDTLNNNGLGAPVNPMPYLGDVDINDPIYQNTRRFVWSKDNPYFFKGKAGEGIGGPHIGYDMIWPMSIMMKAFTSQDDQEIKSCIKMLMDTDAGTGFMHESFHKDDPKNFTRAWFAWQNTLFGELILKLVNEGKIDLLNNIQ